MRICSKFLAPILLAVISLVIAAENGPHDSNLYQFLDFTRVQNSQKNENRHFKWLAKLRRSKNRQPAHSEPASIQPEDQYDSPKPIINYGDDNSSPSYNPSFPEAAFKIAPFSLQKPGKNAKQSSKIILPPLPFINQKSATSHGTHNSIYGSKQDHISAIIQSVSPHKQTQTVATSPATNKQPEEPIYSSLELAFNAPKPSNKQRTPVQSEVSHNSPQLSFAPGSEYHADFVSPPTHSDSRYSKWLNKLRRRKSNHNQPEKPHHEPIKTQDKPSEVLSGLPEPIYYQNASPYNSPQPSINQFQPGNGQSYSHHPQIENNSPQVAPGRPANIKQHSLQPAALSSPVQPISYDSQNAPEPSQPSGNLYKKLMKKIKRNKTHKPEPSVTAISQPEPIFNPIQTAFNNPPSDASVYRHPQTSAQSSPPRPAQQNIKPAPLSSLNQDFNKPAMTHSEAPIPYSPQNNSPSKPHIAPVQKPSHSLQHESDAFFPPPNNRPEFVPFQKQTEKVQGNNNEESEGFFDFGIFPQSNGFFDQNFKG